MNTKVLSGVDPRKKSMNGTISVTNKFFHIGFRNLGWNFLSSVQELVDNSLDAGASLIQISYSLNKKFGRRYTLSDNGCGMTQKTLFEAFKNLGYEGSDYEIDSIGHYGVGMRAAFANLVAPGGKATITTTRDEYVSTLIFEQKDPIPVRVDTVYVPGSKNGTVIEWDSNETSINSSLMKNLGITYFPARVRNEDLDIQVGQNDKLESITFLDPLYREETFHIWKDAVVNPNINMSEEFEKIKFEKNLPFRFETEYTYENKEWDINSTHIPRHFKGHHVYDKQPSNYSSKEKHQPINLDRSRSGVYLRLPNRYIILSSKFIFVGFNSALNNLRVELFLDPFNMEDYGATVNKSKVEPEKILSNPEFLTKRNSHRKADNRQGLYDNSLEDAILKIVNNTRKIKDTPTNDSKKIEGAKKSIEDHVEKINQEMKNDEQKLPNSGKSQFVPTPKTDLQYYGIYITNTLPKESKDGSCDITFKVKGRNIDNGTKLGYKLVGLDKDDLNCPLNGNFTFVEDPITNEVSQQDEFTIRITKDIIDDESKSKLYLVLDDEDTPFGDERNPVKVNIPRKGILLSEDYLNKEKKPSPKRKKYRYFSIDWISGDPEDDYFEYTNDVDEGLVIIFNTQHPYVLVNINDVHHNSAEEFSDIIYLTYAFIKDLIDRDVEIDDISNQKEGMSNILYKTHVSRVK